MKQAGFLMAGLVAGGVLLAQFGPKDGQNLPPVDLERVKVGAPAPDFTLPRPDKSALSLSDLRGKTVVLVFYRGYW